MKRGNPNHWPAGTPLGGQFAPKHTVGFVRSEPMRDDIESYCSDFGQGSEKERIENVNQALYDGGYIKECDGSLHGFKSVGEAERFVRAIATRHNEKGAWKNHKELVNNYVDIISIYLHRGKFDFVTNGVNSRDRTKRYAEELTEELGWERERVKQTLLNCLTSDSFVNSGANNSRYSWNKGTVVMIFSPRVETIQYYTDPKTGQKMMRRKVIDLYVKLAVNPHPGRNGDGSPQSEVQILSFKEAGITEKNNPKLGKVNPKTCLYTGEEHRSRWEWRLPQFKSHKDRPLTLKELREKKNE